MANAERESNRNADKTGKSASFLTRDEQKEFGQMKSKIAKAEAEFKRLQVLPAPPPDHHGELNQHFQKVAAAQQELANLFERWAYLEGKKAGGK